MVSRISSLGLFGLNAFSVDVEVDICRGQPHFEIVGLPDASVRESRERIRSALNSISVVLPAKRITVNLAPADVKKSGTMHDLAILIGILQSMGNMFYWGSLPQWRSACGEWGFTYGTAGAGFGRRGVICSHGQCL